ncbi:hypothetical protein VMUT_0440 [Vulcanisaeta moutnovskia 768-28]|uniref:Uncharacterized protein n=1 Tax=Vulcanisaeta moutnovskia (strain 768-28) TaxID=985053 RepID=F0QUB2_VULM7|nr:hypothetical protein VMUT_0440 [Vulcanisaeta moutnovskia 768-28]
MDLIRISSSGSITYIVIKPLRVFKHDLTIINELKTLHISGLLRGIHP